MTGCAGSSRMPWSAEAFGLVLANLIVGRLVPGGEPVLAAIDDTLITRTGRKVLAIGGSHDGSATGPRQVRRMG